MVSLLEEIFGMEENLSLHDSGFPGKTKIVFLMFKLTPNFTSVTEYFLAWKL